MMGLTVVSSFHPSCSDWSSLVEVDRLTSMSSPVPNVSLCREKNVLNLLLMCLWLVCCTLFVSVWGSGRTPWISQVFGFRLQKHLELLNTFERERKVVLDDHNICCFIFAYFILFGYGSRVVVMISTPYWPAFQGGSVAMPLDWACVVFISSCFARASVNLLACRVSSDDSGVDCWLSRACRSHFRSWKTDWLD